MPNSAAALLWRPRLAEQKKGRIPFRMPLLDGVPIIAPIIMSLVVIFAGAFDAIPANMIGGLAVILVTGGHRSLLDSSGCVTQICFVDLTLETG